jgi:hypothetical protein
VVDRRPELGLPEAFAVELHAFLHGVGRLLLPTTSEGQRADCLPRQDFDYLVADPGSRVLSAVDGLFPILAPALDYGRAILSCPAVFCHCHAKPTKYRTFQSGSGIAWFDRTSDRIKKLTQARVLLRLCRTILQTTVAQRMLSSSNGDS